MKSCKKIRTFREGKWNERPELILKQVIADTTFTPCVINLEKAGQVLLITGDKDRNFVNFNYYDNVFPYNEIVPMLHDYTRVNSLTWRKIKEM